jgi:hypothetical protein
MLDELEPAKVLEGPQWRGSGAVASAQDLSGAVPHGPGAARHLGYSLLASVMSWLGHEPLYGRDLSEVAPGFSPAS